MHDGNSKTDLIDYQKQLDSLWNIADKKINDVFKGIAGENDLWNCISDVRGKIREGMGKFNELEKNADDLDQIYIPLSLTKDKLNSASAAASSGGNEQEASKYRTDFRNGSQRYIDEVKQFVKNLKSQQEKSTPIDQEKSTPIDQEKSTPIDQEKSTPIDQEKSTPIDQEKSTPIDQEKSTPIEQSRDIGIGARRTSCSDRHQPISSKPKDQEFTGR